MNLQELLKTYLEEEKIKSLLEDMKNNKIFTASEENLDIRYKDLQDKFSAKDKELSSANELISSLKESNKGNEDLQAKITDYDTKVAQLQAENEQLKLDNAIKVGLLANKAKPEDLDYLIFKIKQDKELKLDKDGEIKGFDFKEVKTTFPNNFEAESKKEVNVNNLPNIKDQEPTVTKEQFDKMGYSSRVKLKETSPEIYNSLASKN
jgi:hypothetical protein